MRYLTKSALVGLGMLAVTGCDAPSTTVAANQTPVEQETATPQTQAIQNAGDGTRLVIYRTSYMGLAVQPAVFVDGQQVGTCAPGQATSVQVAPGNHRVTARTLAENAFEVSVAQGSTVYVRCSITPGLVVGGVKLVEVPSSEAAPKVADMQARAAQ